MGDLSGLAVPPDGDGQALHDRLARGGGVRRKRACAVRPARLGQAHHERRARQGDRQPDPDPPPARRPGLAMPPPVPFLGGMTAPVESYPVDLYSLPHHWSPWTVLAAAYVGIVNSGGPRTDATRRCAA